MIYSFGFLWRFQSMKVEKLPNNRVNSNVLQVKIDSPLSPILEEYTNKNSITDSTTYSIKDFEYSSFFIDNFALKNFNMYKTTM